MTGGYPVEVGWAAVNTANGTVTSNAVLISPRGTDWVAKLAWDPKAEKLHGLTFDYVQVNGLVAPVAANVASLALGDCTVYSDNPHVDERWIDMLYQMARVTRRFSVSKKPAASLVVELADRRRIGDLDYTAAEREARTRCGQRHRAGPDASYWAHLWLMMEQGFRAPPGTAPALGPLRRKP